MAVKTQQNNDDEEDYYDDSGDEEDEDWRWRRGLCTNGSIDKIPNLLRSSDGFTHLITTIFSFANPLSFSTPLVRMLHMNNVMHMALIYSHSTER